MMAIMCWPAALLLLIATGVAVAEKKYDSRDGCDEARWKEWESIIISADGYPEEQEDARGVRDLNRQICDALKAGTLDEAEAARQYDEAVDAWIDRVAKRRHRRRQGSSTQAPT